MLSPGNMNVPVVKRLWPIAAAVLIAAGAAWWWMTQRKEGPRYVTAQVDRGSVVRSVTATGTVNPVIVVQVGTYDSGPIIAIYADFNSPVKAGQLIAKIDPRPFTVKVHQAEAALGNAQSQLGKDQADLAYKKLTFGRDAKLHAENVISQDTLDNARSAFQQDVSQVALDRAMVKQQQANLEEAQVNLDYTNIISPVDGTVVSRNVDVGQTVAASFQTPTLFLIAKDLTQMQVDTNVSESDIGDVREGETAEFGVDAFPDRVFEGTLGQVRQVPISVQNVTTYDVVVNVPNPEFLLKPGMTANVTITTARRDNVLRIPIQALRFSPTSLSALSAMPISTNPAGSHERRVWVADSSVIRPVSIVAGLDDGHYVEIVSGDLRPGESVVTAGSRPVDTSTAAPPASSSTLRFAH
jgi:HlyD family secretion protein